MVAHAPGARVAVVAGIRTPFCKIDSDFRDLSALELGKLCVGELVQRADLDPDEIDQVIYGQVVLSVGTPNIAREIVLGTGLPRRIEAYSVTRACATSLQALANGADAITLGHAACVVVGGADSVSDPPVLWSKQVSQALSGASRARSLKERVVAFRKLRPRDLLPVPPALTEPSTGLTMGESAEKMAKENGISREDQDAFALRSHTLAARAWAEGRFDDQVMHAYLPPAYQRAATRDNVVRDDSTLAKLAALKPAFDRRYGTVTAGNSSPLTDGASALVLMREDKARALGYAPLGYLRSYAFAALDPAGQMLMGPSYATPIALDRARVKLKDLDLIDMHEAFAAQVLSNVRALGSLAFARDQLGRGEPVGDIDMDRFNVNGGSIALGHPFAATGARVVLQLLRELRRRDRNLGLVTLCAAGGLGAAAVFSRE
ncbi:MAG TPA: acetyl-CoA C-acyltransferase FadI [Polyangia bacterium]|jgi:acetyl-CoA acyltransferase